MRQAVVTAVFEFAPQLAVIWDRQPGNPQFTPSPQSLTAASTLQTNVKCSHLGYKVIQSLSYPHLPWRPPLHPSQIKLLSDFCFPNLWTLTEAPTLEREATQHGMISRWQGEAETTFPGMSLLKLPDHPVIFLFLFFSQSVFLSLCGVPSIHHLPIFNLIPPPLPPSIIFLL